MILSLIGIMALLYGVKESQNILLRLNLFKFMFKLIKKNCIQFLAADLVKIPHTNAFYAYIHKTSRRLPQGNPVVSMTSMSWLSTGGVWKTRKAGTTQISRNGFIFAIIVTCKHYHSIDGEDFVTELTQFFYYTVAFNIILTIKQLCSAHGESKYLGEH